MNVKILHTKIAMNFNLKLIQNFSIDNLKIYPHKKIEKDEATEEARSRCHPFFSRQLISIKMKYETL